jgi:tetratricopeptide (TPR) repeat protein
LVAAPVLLPTVTPAPLEQPAPSSSLPQPLPAQDEVALNGVRHAWQTWNNCGPATLAMNLSFYGSPLDQAAVGAALRPFEDDKNVNPEEMAAYARAQGFHAQVRVNGDAETLRRLLSNGFPVLIETWLEPEPNDGMGHYRLLTGYEHAAQRWIAFDSYDATNPVSADPALYAGIYLPYAEMDALWAVFNRTYLLVYPPDREDALRAILGDAFDEEAMWQAALAQAQSEAAADAQNPFAWFNLGTSFAHLGDHAAAAAAYDQARAIGLPWRMLWYQFGPFAAYHAVGRYADMLSLADAVLAATTSIEEIHYWRGLALAGLGDEAAARAAWQAALDLNPAYAPAQAVLEPSP